MGNLKPIGSEKLQGEDKLKRIIEISRYNENSPKSINETSRSDYAIQLSDGNNYEIVKEKQGYIIKKRIDESTIDYIEPMKNRKYYSSYSQAFKRLNLLAAELNRVNDNKDGISLFGEQKKYVLKTPTPAEPAPAPADAVPPAVPSPELPPSPDSEAVPADDLGMPDDMGVDDMGVDDMGMDDDSMNQMDDDVVTFKTIQKLTGKLTQKVRTFDDKEGMTSEQIKYVINMVLSSMQLNNLTEEDRDDVLSKFEDDVDSEDLGMDDLGMDDTEVEPIDDMPPSEDEMGGIDVPQGTTESEEIRGAIIDSIFNESKVDNVIKKYFDITESEIRQKHESRKQNINEAKLIAKKKMNEVFKYCSSILQEVASEKFLQENPTYNFVGKTNKKNLVFENSNKQIRITPKGIVL